MKQGANGTIPNGEAMTQKETMPSDRRVLHLITQVEERFQEKMSRREWMHKSVSAAGWGALFLAAGIGGYQSVKFFYPSVVFHPPSVFRIGKLDDFLVEGKPDLYGVICVENRFKNEHRFFVVREEQRIYALFARCTHLGCTVNWFEEIRTFKCPCHGSEFHANGVHFAGPAPRPLDRLKISRDSGGDILVDTRKVFSFQEFEEKKIYLKVTV